MPVPKPKDAAWTEIISDQNPGLSAQIFNIDGTYYGQNVASVVARNYLFEAGTGAYQVQPRGDVMATDQELFDQKLKATSAETDTKLARFEGKIDVAVTMLGGKIDAMSDKISADHEYNRATRWVMVGLLITCTFALAGLAVTMATYGDALFGRGMNVRDVMQTTIKETLEQVRKEEAAKLPK